MKKTVATIILSLALTGCYNSSDEKAQLDGSKVSCTMMAEDALFWSIKGQEGYTVQQRITELKEYRGDIPGYPRAVEKISDWAFEYSNPSTISKDPIGVFTKACGRFYPEALPKLHREK